MATAVQHDGLLEALRADGHDVELWADDPDLLRAYASAIGFPVWARSDRADCLWFMFATEEARDAKLAEMLGSWVALEDRSVLLNYVLTWVDVQGFGLEVTHAAWAPRTGHRA
jgi:hypothetical protein